MCEKRYFMGICSSSPPQDKNGENVFDGVKVRTKNVDAGGLFRKTLQMNRYVRQSKVHHHSHVFPLLFHKKEDAHT
jgi:hypothetical protein